MALLPFDVKKRLWSLGVAEGNLAQTALDDELLVLGLELRRFNRTLDLLLHSLHMVVAIDMLPSSPAPAPRLI